MDVFIARPSTIKKAISAASKPGVGGRPDFRSLEILAKVAETGKPDMVIVMEQRARKALSDIEQYESELDKEFGSDSDLWGDGV